MKKTTKIFGLLLTLFGLALVTGCTPITDTPDVPEETTYTVTIASDIANGTVTADRTYKIVADETITLTVTPNGGYELENITVNNGAVSLSGEGNTRTFTMPASNVTVDATFTKTAETLNREAADAVIAKINAIGTVEYTDTSKAKIDDARAAYNALTDAQKALVTNYSTLTTAEETYKSLIPSTPTETGPETNEPEETPAVEEPTEEPETTEDTEEPSEEEPEDTPAELPTDETDTDDSGDISVDEPSSGEEVVTTYNINLETGIKFYKQDGNQNPSTFFNSDKKTKFIAKLLDRNIETVTLESEINISSLDDLNRVKYYGSYVSNDNSITDFISDEEFESLQVNETLCRIMTYEISGNSITLEYKYLEESNN